MSKTNSPIVITDYDRVLTEMVRLLEDARSTAARSVNAVMTATYWEIGRRIVEEEHDDGLVSPRSLQHVRTLHQVAFAFSAQPRHFPRR